MFESFLATFTLVGGAFTVFLAVGLIKMFWDDFGWKLPGVIAAFLVLWGIVHALLRMGR